MSQFAPNQDERLSRYLDDDLDLAERMALEEAFRTQPLLRARLKAIESSLALLRAAFPAEEPPLDITLKVMQLGRPTHPRSRFVYQAMVKQAAQRDLRSIRGHASRARFRRIRARRLRLSKRPG